MIKNAGLLDIVEITKLWRKLCIEVKMPYPNENMQEAFAIGLLHHISSSNSIVLVAKHNEKTIGFLLSYLKNVNYSGEVVIFVECIYVERKYRHKRGIADSMLKRVADLTKNIKRKEFAIMYSEDKINYWKKRGFFPTIVTLENKHGS